MDKKYLSQQSEFTWRIEPHGKMRVPGILYVDEALLEELDEKVFKQVINVASLPGIVKSSYAMPDAHWGYGFPIGGVAAFDAEKNGVISAGGVGFDISCGVRTLTTGLSKEEIEPYKKQIADALFSQIPAGVGSTGNVHLDKKEMEHMLRGGAKWAIEQGYGQQQDLDFIEEKGEVKNAKPEAVSDKAKQRQRDEMGTLGSGNHYLEIQYVSELLDNNPATNFGLRVNDILISIHCGSRGLGHQIGTEFLKKMVVSASQFHIELPERELACAPIDSPLGQEYLGAMRAGINCAMANRQILTHLVRESFDALFPKAQLDVLYDVSHNTCKEEKHVVDGREKNLFVHRKGATRAFGPDHRALPHPYRKAGQPVLIGGSMGTASYILAGTAQSEELAFSSACHGAGRTLSRTAAKKRWQGSDVIRELSEKGILIRNKSNRGVAEEAPGAYKDVNVVVEISHRAGLARKVARLKPLITVKG